MSEIAHLAMIVERHFAEPEGGTFTAFVAATAGLTGEQAAKVPAPRFNSVWAVVNHIAFWMDVTRAGMIGQEIDLAAWGLTEMGGGWPPLGEVSDAAWLAARQRALDINHAFAEAVSTLDPATFDVPVAAFWNQPPRQAVLAIYAHNSYHTAEIICIRHMQELWVDHPWA